MWFSSSGGRLPNAQPHAFISQNFQLMRVIRGPQAQPGVARKQRMHAARVIAQHAPQRAMRVRRRIGAERQAVLLGLVPQIVEHAAGLTVASLRSGSICSTSCRYLE